MHIAGEWYKAERYSCHFQAFGLSFSYLIPIFYPFIGDYDFSADMSTPVNKDEAIHEKSEVVHQDDALFRTASEAGPEKPLPRIGKVDYSGAYEKTDPKEIALVKKLDRWIMPMLWCEYLNKSLVLTQGRTD